MLDQSTLIVTGTLTIREYSEQQRTAKRYEETYKAFLDKSMQSAPTPSNKLHGKAETTISGVGSDYLYLTVTSTNDSAKKLYQSLGFKTYGTDKQALKIKNKYFD